jgi:hypothetical protein
VKNINKTLLYAYYFLAAIYLCWYVAFESADLPNKIDTHIHLVRSQNILDALKSFDLFPSWHEAPFWGYPEDFNYFISYLLIALMSFFIPIVAAIKAYTVLALFFAAVSARRFMKLFFESDLQVFLGSVFYMASASFVNFGIGSGSLTRVAGIAVFPFLLTTFINWYRTPDHPKLFKLAIIFYMTYLIHPFSAMCGILSSLTWPFFEKGPLTLKQYSKRVLKLGALCSLLFSWQIGNLIIARKYISWDELYNYYSQYFVSIDLQSFLGFWLDTQGRTVHFYFGALPFLITLVAPFLWIRKKENQKILWFGLTLSFIGFVLILLVSHILKRNTFRFDMIYNLGTAICVSYVLAQIKYKSIAIAFMLFITLEQTWYARPFGGISYVDREFLQRAHTLIPNEFKHPRVLMEPQSIWIITPKQVQWLSPSYGLQYHGFLELTPYNLGMFPHIQDIKQPEALLDFLGIPLANNQEKLGIATEYSKYLIIKAPSRRLSFEKVYLPLLKNASFNPYRMPLVYEASENDISITNSDKSFIISPDSPDWEKNIFMYFSQNEVTEKSDWSTTPGRLLVIKEAFHPRRNLVTDQGLLEFSVVEPGLIGVYSDKKFGSGSIRIKSSFTVIEMILGMVSLATLLTMMCTLLYWGKRTIRFSF